VPCPFRWRRRSFSSSALAGPPERWPAQSLAARQVEAAGQDGLPAADVVRYDGDIMMSRMQITLEGEISAPGAAQRANDLGVS